MDFTQTMLGWANQIPAGLVALLQLIGIALLAGWFYWRAGSAHVFWVRIWTLMHGKRELNDPVIGPWIAKRSALMQLRVHAGIRVRTHAEGVRLIQWADRHDEELGDVARCRWLFDLAKPGLVSPLPRRWMVLALALVAVALLLFTVWAGALTLSPRAIVSVKNGSGASMLLSTDKIKPLWSSETFDASDCRTETVPAIAARTGLPAPEVTVACGWLKDPSFAAQVKDALHAQHVGGLSLTGLGLLYLSFPLTWLLAAGAAFSMAKRLKSAASRTSEPYDVETYGSTADDVSLPTV